MVKQAVFTKYEKARIIGARALQLSMDAPILLKLSKDELDKLNYDPLRIAEKEFEEGVLPIYVERPMPLKKEGELKKIEKEKLLKELEKEINPEEETTEEIVEDLDEEEETESFAEEA
ncbi:MAG: DNA-directed RNA polymerase subunit K [Candidatus Pacearchaeota archaeon]